MTKLVTLLAAAALTATAATTASASVLPEMDPVLNSIVLPGQDVEVAYLYCDWQVRYDSYGNAYWEYACF